MYLVSIIIPAYNAEAFISNTLDSVLNQTWPNWEAIVVNDGSQDNTEFIVQNYAKRDSRIVLISQSNAGCSYAKNTGLSLVKGDFIQYLDADDLLSENKIEEQINFIAANDRHIAVSPTKVFNSSINEPSIRDLDTGFLYTSENPLEFLLNLYGINGKAGMIQPNAFLISRKLSEVIGKWDTSISPSPDEDGEYFCRAILNSSKIWFTPNCINYYRKQVGNKSLSRQISHLHAFGALRSLDLKLQHILEKENSVRIKRLFANQFSEYIYTYYLYYPDLCMKAEAYVNELGFNKLPSTGGVYFKMLAQVTGFKPALKIKKYLLGILKRS
jgi:glycosyltransferase involved in cell wall biosynthesis